MAEIKIPPYKYTPPTIEKLIECLNEDEYVSPISIIDQGIRTQFERDIMRVIRSYDISVDKNELIKALRYDRDQYQKGYKEGCKDVATEVARAIYIALHNEIIEARVSNYEAIRECEEKHNVNRYEDIFCQHCDGKIMALDGILHFLTEFIKKYTGSEVSENE